MSSIRQLLVFLTGHRLSSNTPAGEVGSLTKIGAAIAFASILAAIQFGIAGWFLAINLFWPLQLMMALVCASIGALIVLVLDRNFIYLADTRYESEKNIAYIYLGIRIFLITVIGSLSSQSWMAIWFFLKGRHSNEVQMFDEIVLRERRSCQLLLDSFFKMRKSQMDHALLMHSRMSLEPPDTLAGMGAIELDAEEIPEPKIRSGKNEMPNLEDESSTS